MRNLIIMASVTCLLFTPTILIAIPAVFPPVIPDIDIPDWISTEQAEVYALNYAGGYRYLLSQDNFEELTYFSFYTFFKPGIEPDCIEMICDDDSSTIIRKSY